MLLVGVLSGKRDGGDVREESTLPLLAWFEARRWHNKPMLTLCRYLASMVQQAQTGSRRFRWNQPHRPGPAQNLGMEGLYDPLVPPFDVESTLSYHGNDDILALPCDERWHIRNFSITATTQVHHLSRFILQLQGRRFEVLLNTLLGFNVHLRRLRSPQITG